MKLPKLPKYTVKTDLQKLVELESYDSTLKGINDKTQKEYDIHTWNMIMTPEGAKQLLAVKFHNRPKSSTHINRMVDDMNNGKWHTSYDPIKIDSDYKLSDGQHRLEAIIKSGISVPVVLYYPVQEEQYKFIDQGIRRTGSHQIHMQGIADAPLIASGLKQIHEWSANKPNVGTAPSLDVLDDYKLLYLNDLEKNKSLVKLIKKDRSKKVNHGELLALITILKDFHSNDIVDEYIEQIFYPPISLLDEKYHPITRTNKYLVELTQRSLENKIKVSTFNREVLSSLYFGFIPFSKNQKLKSYAKDSFDQIVSLHDSSRVSYNQRIADFANNKVVGNFNKKNILKV